MYKCAECGHLFEEGEQAIWYENRGECWGFPSREKMVGCPVCHGDYEEASECECCGKWHYSDEMVDGICERCLYEIT